MQTDLRIAVIFIHTHTHVHAHTHVQQHITVYYSINTPLNGVMAVNISASCQFNHMYTAKIFHYMSQRMRFWYLSHR